MDTPASASSPSFFPSEPTFDLVVQQWAKARIDAPMRMITRFDDAGKQLVTIGSTLQAVYIALFVTGAGKAHLPGRWIVLMSLSLAFVVIFAALAVCAVHIKTEALGTFELFKTKPGLSDEQLTHALSAWCEHIDRTAKWKRLLLLCAKGSLLINLIISIVILFNALWGDGWS